MDFYNDSCCGARQHTYVIYARYFLLQTLYIFDILKL